MTREEMLAIEQWALDEYALIEARYDGRDEEGQMCEEEAVVNLVLLKLGLTRLASIYRGGYYG